jgi:spore coat protein U-like protein
VTFLRLMVVGATLCAAGLSGQVASAQGRGGGNSCTISATPLMFGAYNVFDVSPTVSTGAVLFRCGPAVGAISIGLGPGQAGSYAARTLVDGVEALTYNLYLDAARTIVWGDGSGGSQMYLSNNPPKSADVQLTVYGKIDSFQDVSAGSYADTVTVTVNF